MNHILAFSWYDVKQINQTKLNPFLQILLFFLFFSPFSFISLFVFSIIIKHLQMN